MEGIRSFLKIDCFNFEINQVLTKAKGIKKENTLVDLYTYTFSLT